jgi:hypothetical protein
MKPGGLVPKNKREGAGNANAPANVPPTAYAAMQQVANKAWDQRDAADRTAVMAEATRVVEACVASAPAGIDQTRELFDALWKDQFRGFTDAERHQLLRELLRRLFGSDQLGLLVERDADFFRALLTHLTNPKVREAPGERDRYILLRQLIDAVFASAGLDKIATVQTDFVASLLMTAARMTTNRDLAAYHNPSPDFITTKLAALGKLAPQVAAAFVGAHWKAAPAELGPDLMTWVFKVIQTPQWNDPKTELAARGLNLLWTAGDYDGICKLITDGVDCTLSAKAWGGPDREGVYTGYIQPTTHVLGRYLKSISLLDTDGEKGLTDVARVRGAQQIVQVLGKLTPPPKIVLHYPTINECQMVTLFDTDPGTGTIWGFEDVRLPYVQAARDRKNGQRPLRMLDMWDAITPVFKDYHKLISHPRATIASCVAKGVESVRAGIRDRNRQYEGIKEAQYIPQFERMCKDFLTYFAARRPYGAYVEPTSRSGKAQAKLLTGYACTVGIHWSADRNIPLYYCLDGLNMDDVFNYKSYKVKEIDAYLGGLDKSSEELLDHGPFQEVITLAEVREIIRRWDKFKHVVRFVENGVLVPPEVAEARVLKWQVALGLAEKDKHRSWSAKTTFEEEAINLTGNLEFWVKVGVRERWKCFKESNTIDLAAKNVESIELLLQVLEKDCPTLQSLSLLPTGFVELLRTAVEADSATRPALLAKLRDALATLVCPGLRGRLGAAIDRHFGPPPKLLMPPDPLVGVELYVEPVPGAVPVVISSPDPVTVPVPATVTGPADVTGPITPRSPPVSQPPPPSPPPSGTPGTPSGTPGTTPFGDG